MELQYREHRPPADLADLIECFWTLRADGTGRPGEEVPDQILPDGCPELILNLGDPFREPGDRRPRPDISFAGQLRQGIHLLTPHRLDAIAIRFQPAGAAALFGPTIHELTDRIAPLDTLDPALTKELTAAVDGCGDDPGRIRRLTHTLRAHVAGNGVRRAGDPMHLALEASRMILAGGGDLRMDQVATRLGISTRHLDRVFKPRVGVGPKFFARMIRFQRLLEAAENGPPARWVDLALRCGFSDQAHLNREVRSLAGTTPPSLQLAEREFTRLFTRTRRPV